MDRGVGSTPALKAHHTRLELLNLNAYPTASHIGYAELGLTPVLNPLHEGC